MLPRHDEQRSHMNPNALPATSQGFATSVPITLSPVGNVRDHVFTDHPRLAADPALARGKSLRTSTSGGTLAGQQA